MHQNSAKNELKSSTSQRFALKCLSLSQAFPSPVGFEFRYELSSTCQVVAVLFGLSTGTGILTVFSSWCHLIVPFLREGTNFLHLWSSFVSGKCQCSPTISAGWLFSALHAARHSFLPLKCPTTFCLLRKSPAVGNVPNTF